MASVETLSSIQSDLKRKRDELKAIENDIKRVTGRDPNEARELKRQANISAKIEKLAAASKNKEIDFPTPNKRQMVMYGNNEDEPDHEKKSEHPSSNVFQVKANRSRADAVRSLESSDRERGRRMFGLIQGTLSAARKENEIKSKSVQEERRREIVARLDEKAKEEKERMRKQRTELFRNRREHQIELNTLQQKIRLTKEFESWRENSLTMIGCIRTNSKPHLFYSPKVETPESRKRVEETENCIHDMIVHREQRLTVDLEENARFGKLRLSKLDSLDVHRHSDDENDRLMSRVVVQSLPLTKLESANDNRETSNSVSSSVMHVSQSSTFVKKEDNNSELETESDTRKVSLCTE